ncbi:hypothetical protein OIU77_003275 [Salix suchowensis]|uniref:Uncharacterized protein n=1 Tax=Salix suchowensis TaxID=1278906 RepID=A0ABQ9B0D2_9ROSI|nr:hypothetical protein OIU77_003275 [Salix suchowensis]
MASSTLRYYFTFTIFLFAIFLAFSPRIQAQGAGTSLEAMSDALEWPMSMYFDESSELDDGLEFLVLRGLVDRTIATTASSLRFLSILTQEGALGSLVAGDESQVLLGQCLIY